MPGGTRRCRKAGVGVQEWRRPETRSRFHNLAPGRCLPLGVSAKNVPRIPGRFKIRVSPGVLSGPPESKFKVCAPSR